MVEKSINTLKNGKQEENYKFYFRGCFICKFMGASAKQNEFPNGGS
jgi:hypothetical protein